MQGHSEQTPILDKLTAIESQITAQTEAIAAQTAALSMQKDVLTFREACTYLDVSASHLYKLTSQGRIPHSKPNGKRVYFSRKELDAWLMSNPAMTDAELQRTADTYCATHPTRKTGTRRNAS